jgi:hypothetical protein
LASVRLNFDASIHAMPLTINPGASVMSPIMPSFDLPRQKVAVLSKQAGQLVLNRFLDKGGCFVLDSTTAAMRNEG